MATANNVYGLDSTDPYNQVRQRMLGYANTDPSVDIGTSTVPDSSAASPDFAPTPASGTNAGIQSPIVTANAGSSDTTPDYPSTDPTARVGYPTARVPPTGPIDPNINPQPNVTGAGPVVPTTTAPVAPQAVAATSSPVTATTNPFTDQIRKLILSRLQAMQGPVDPNNPEISSTLGAARDEASRASDQERTALAERLYAQGIGTGGSGALGSNALTQQIQQSGERNAGALSTLRGQLLMNEYNQRNQELQNLLQLATTTGDAESARAIQAQIANLQAAVQRENLGVNLGEFQAQLNQNSTLAGLNG